MLTPFTCTSSRVAVLSVGRVGLRAGAGWGPAGVRQFRAGHISRLEKTTPNQAAATAGLLTNFASNVGERRTYAGLFSVLCYLGSTDQLQHGKTTVDLPKSKVHGSYHWQLERYTSVVTLPLIGSAFVVGSNPYIDLALGVIIPLHCHIGFDACITDYFDSRKAPTINKVMKAALYGSTALVLYGCYQFNTNDVGITEGTKRLWTGRS
ncbi:membrane anchor subunit of succinate dehydrogenase, Sdh4 [Rhizophlyctis rosea]|uniref:Succinate dehydrogenase [ubiquinone] cytochrome b small subunit n=1 Tax=Rhizophlyctis rosea TaxID=64517 RepID=A0AAD5S3A7_9FUNG|nr:membrane anchor subunit of succinate dehydrogenase, Sdh4 [Rhizophlyctis rosea]